MLGLEEGEEEGEIEEVEEEEAFLWNVATRWILVEQLRKSFPSLPNS